ncbi:MAG: ATP-dependent zinc metalloprotease FtsH [Tissierellia bacterium]|nr:ATP-dependent zinc metalloprotease FtsH [Tissierellia bacterium]
MNRRWGGVAFYLVLLAVLMIGIGLFRPPSRAIEEISYTSLVEEVQAGNIKQMDIQGSEVTAKMDGDKLVKAQIPPLAQDNFYELYIKDRVESGQLEVKGHKTADQGTSLMSILPSLLVLGLLGFMFFNFVRGSQSTGSRMSNFGKSKARLIQEDKSNQVTFSDVAGLKEEKEELGEIVDFLKTPKKFVDMGARIPKGVLLVGPPGTGKTYLSKAVAGEAKVPFYIMSGSDFVEMYVGVGASRVRDLFETAKKNAPCIIFIDEIDAVGRRRGAGVGGGHDEREQTLNQLLVEMDGFGTNEGVIVMAATNRSDILDPALMRPGRFDRTVYVGLPDVRERVEILKVHSRKKPLAKDVDLNSVAKTTPGFTPADLENLMNEAALLSARRGDRRIYQDDIIEATIKVEAGPAKKSRVISEKERKLTAVHEAGHALVSRLLPGHDPVHMITIIPRGPAGGFTAYLPEEDSYFITKGQLQHKLVSLLGGRVAESLVLDDISTGASNDIERATKIANAMVTRYGFSEKIGTLTYGVDEESVFMGRDLGHTQQYSEEITSEIDMEMRRLVKEAYSQAEDLIKDHLDILLAVSDALLERETISGQEFEEIFQGKKLDPVAKEEGMDARLEKEDLSEEAKEILEDQGKNLKDLEDLADSDKA